MKITASDFMRDWVTANIHACADPAEAGFDAEPGATMGWVGL